MYNEEDVKNLANEWKTNSRWTASTAPMEQKKWSN